MGPQRPRDRHTAPPGIASAAATAPSAAATAGEATATAAAPRAGAAGGTGRRGERAARCGGEAAQGAAEVADAAAVEVRRVGPDVPGRPGHPRTAGLQLGEDARPPLGDAVDDGVGQIAGEDVLPLLEAQLLGLRRREVAREAARLLVQGAPGCGALPPGPRRDGGGD